MKNAASELSERFNVSNIGASPSQRNYFPLVLVHHKLERDQFEPSSLVGKRHLFCSVQEFNNICTKFDLK
jgi:hypothetical protein